MDKKRFLRIGILQMLLMLMLPRDALALAREKTGGVSTEVRWLERDGQKIYGRLYLPEKTDAPLPLVILSHGLGSNHSKMEPYAESFAENGCTAGAGRRPDSNRRGRGARVLRRGQGAC